jgi:hypothetical protein
MRHQTLMTENGVRTRTSAADRIDELNYELRRGTWVDPRAGQTLLGDWGHDVSPGTWTKCSCHFDNHILPKFGPTPIAEIKCMAVEAWVKPSGANSTTPPSPM